MASEIHQPRREHQSSQPHRCPLPPWQQSQLQRYPVRCASILAQQGGPQSTFAHLSHSFPIVQMYNTVPQCVRSDILVLSLPIYNSALKPKTVRYGECRKMSTEPYRQVPGIRRGLFCISIRMPQQLPSTRVRRGSTLPYENK